MKYPGAIQVYKAVEYTMIGNSVAGSEKMGLITAGVPCSDETAKLRIHSNEVSFSFFLLKRKLFNFH